MQGNEFVSELVRIDPALDAPLIARAHTRSLAAHAGQLRRSGDPYHSHAEEVAAILAGLRLDSATVAAGLLHDVIEESEVGGPRPSPRVRR